MGSMRTGFRNGFMYIMYGITRNREEQKSILESNNEMEKNNQPYEGSYTAGFTLGICSITGGATAGIVYGVKLAEYLLRL